MERKEALARVMFAKYNAGMAEEDPGIAWDAGVAKVSFGLFASKEEWVALIDGQQTTLREYALMLTKTASGKTLEEYVKEIEEREL